MSAKPLRMIRSLIRRARVSLSSPDTGNYPKVQVEYLGKTAMIEVIWPYGMGGRLPVDSLPFVFNVEGMEENKAGIGTDPVRRKKVDAEGEVWMGNPLAGTLIYFKEDGTIEAGLDGSTFRKLIDERFITLFNSHTHSGVTAGGGVTGAPVVPLAPGGQETTNFKAA